MIKWPERALKAVVKLFEPLQDIDVYVEDANDEVFYTRLLKRIAQDEVKIERVFSSGCRQAVIDAATSHDSTKRRALFIIDGDFDWVVGTAPPSVPSLFRWEAYCVENLLVCERAFLNVVMEEAVLSEEDAIKKLDFASFISTVRDPLTDLFCAFATAHHHPPASATVSKGVGHLCSTTCARGIAKLDESKVDAERLHALSQAASIVGNISALEFYGTVRKRARGLPMQIDIVSGKDFLLPLLDFHLHSLGIKVKRKSLRLKLALHCNMERFSSLKTAMEQVARGV